MQSHSTLGRLSPDALSYVADHVDPGTPLELSRVEKNYDIMHGNRDMAIFRSHIIHMSHEPSERLCIISCLRHKPLPAIPSKRLTTRRLISLLVQPLSGRPADTSSLRLCNNGMDIDWSHCTYTRTLSMWAPISTTTLLQVTSFL